MFSVVYNLGVYPTPGEFPGGGKFIVVLEAERLERVLNYGHDQGFLNIEDQVAFGFTEEREVIYTVRVAYLSFRVPCSF